MIYLLQQLKKKEELGQQVDLRLQQLFFWPRQYMMLRKQNWANTAKTRAYYISFYNSMWLVANDIIIGLAIGSYLMANHTIMSIKFHQILHVKYIPCKQKKHVYSFSPFYRRIQWSHFNP